MAHARVPTTKDVRGVSWLSHQDELERETPDDQQHEQQRQERPSSRFALCRRRTPGRPPALERIQHLFPLINLHLICECLRYSWGSLLSLSGVN